MPQYLMENRAYYTDNADGMLKMLQTDKALPPVVVSTLVGASVWRSLDNDVVQLSGGYDVEQAAVYSDKMGAVTIPNPLAEFLSFDIKHDATGFFVVGIEKQGKTGRLFVSTFPEVPSPAFATRTAPYAISLETSTCMFPIVRATPSHRAFTRYCKLGQTTLTAARVDVDGNVHELGPSGASLIARGETGAWIDDAGTLQVTDAVTGVTRTVAAQVSAISASDSVLVYLSQGLLWATDWSGGSAPRRLTTATKLVRIEAMGQSNVMCHDDRGGLRFAALDGSTTNGFLQYGTTQTHDSPTRYTDAFDANEKNALFFDEMSLLNMKNLVTHERVVLSATADLVYSYGPTHLYWEEPAGPDTDPEAAPLKNVTLFDMVTKRSKRIASGVRPIAGYGVAEMPPVLFAGPGAQGNGLYLAPVANLVP